MADEHSRVMLSLQAWGQELGIRAVGPVGLSALQHLLKRGLLFAPFPAASGMSRTRCFVLLDSSSIIV